MMSAQTESIEITGLPRGTKEAIEELSRSKGKSAEDYLRMLIEAEVLSERSFSEILAPIRQSFRESGMTEEQLDALFEDAREKVHQEAAKSHQANLATRFEDLLVDGGPADETANEMIRAIRERPDQDS